LQVLHPVNASVVVIKGIRRGIEAFAIAVVEVGRPADGESAAGFVKPVTEQQVIAQVPAIPCITALAVARNGGKVLGVCNGFQILCESGLLPGALLPNGNQKFVCKNIHLKNDKGAIYKIPIAHGDGRYFADEKTLDELEANGQVIFYYCDEKGNKTKDANPNEATRNIAGICNAGRNVFFSYPAIAVA